MNGITEFAISALLLVGAAFALLGSLGLARLPDFFTRLHAPTKVTTLGVSGMALASMLYFSIDGTGLNLHAIACVLFLFLTAPIGAQLLTKAALHRRHNETRDSDAQQR